jgi:hypothetical protein
MRYTFIFLLIGSFIALTSCRSDFSFEPSTGDLTFSKDTIYLDTVFSNIGSSTYTLKVYNKSEKDIAIPIIQLGKGNASKFRMMVDGMEGIDADNSGHGDGKIFNNVELLANDSLYIFVETTAEITDANPTDFLYTDQIKFDNGSNLQTVELVTLIQDAIFLYPQKYVDQNTGIISYESLPLGDDSIYGFILDHNEHNDEYIWTNEKPYVIYGYAGIPEGETLTINSGARVHFHENSGIIVGNGGSLKINGTVSNTTALENEVVFEGDRLEPGFADTPGQWGLIWLSQGSINNEINHLTLKNATVGLFVSSVENTTSTTLKINNSQIYNSANVGILARTAKIEGSNLVINSAGQASLACTEGGDYSFKHCTFNNNWQSSKQVAVLISNYKTIDEVITNLTLNKAEFDNCIIYGSNQVEVLLDKKTGSPFNYEFNNCLVKFNDAGTNLNGNALYDVIRNQQNGIIKNKDPKFFSINQNLLNIDSTSPAVAKGSATYLVPMDILGVTRTLPPDIGAYQNAPFPE